MENQQLATQQENLSAEAMERVLIGQDLSRLNPAERLTYYKNVCDSLGLNPLTRPFAYITLNSKLTLYALKDCTEQLRNRDQVSVKIVSRENSDGVYVVVAQASTPAGRCDESIGAVAIENLRGEAKANAIMKAETKAKRRATLSICGLGVLDEEEITGEITAESNIVAQEGKRLEAAGIPAEKAQPLQKGKGNKSAAAAPTEKAVEGRAVESGSSEAENKPEAKQQPANVAPATESKARRLSSMTAEELKVIGEDQVWRAHVVQFMPNTRFAAKRVDSFSLTDLEFIKSEFVDKFAPYWKKSAEKENEAATIYAALTFRQAQKKGEVKSDEEVEKLLNA